MNDVRQSALTGNVYKQPIDMYRCTNQEKCRQEVSNYFLHGYS
jgi:hypothetical protein